MSRNRHVAMWLGCIALMGGLVAACGDDERRWRQQRGSEETGSTEGAKAVDPASMEGAKGEVTVLHRQGHVGRTEGVREAVQRGAPG